MVLNGLAWSRRCGPPPRLRSRGRAFVAGDVHRRSSYNSAVELTRSAGLLPPPPRRSHVGELLEARLLVSGGMSPIATLLSMVHSARAWSKPSLTAQTQFLVSTSGVLDRVLRLLGRLHDDRDDLFAVADTSARLASIIAAIGVDAERRGRPRSCRSRRRSMLNMYFGIISASTSTFSPGFCFLARIDVLGMQRDAVELAGEQAGQAAGEALRDEHRVVHVEAGWRACRGPCAS